MSVPEYIEKTPFFTTGTTMKSRFIGSEMNHAVLLQRANYVCRLIIRSFLIALLIVSAGTYIFFSPPVLTTFIPGLILCPPKNGPEYLLEAIEGIDRQDVYFEGNKAKLHGWFFQARDAKARVLLLCHGNGNNVGTNKDNIAEWLRTGVSVFAFDYQGYGLSSGTPNVACALEDGNAAYDYLVKARGIRRENIILYGQSFGGAVACDIAKQKKVAAGLVVESSFSSLLSVARKQITYFKSYPEFLAPVPALENITVLQSSSLPILLIHGMQDTCIPYSEAERNFASIASTHKRLIALPNSGHGVDNSDRTIYRQGIKRFVAELESGPALCSL